MGLLWGCYVIAVGLRRDYEVIVVGFLWDCVLTAIHTELTCVLTCATHQLAPHTPRVPGGVAAAAVG